MQTLKKKDIKNYKVNLKEGGYDNSERLGDYYQEAIQEFLSPILKKLKPVDAENVVMKIYDAIFSEMDESGDIPKHVEMFIKTTFPKVYSRPELHTGTEELGEEFKSKQQQKYFYAKANDDSLPDTEKAKWKKWASEYSDETDFDKIPQKVEEEELDEFVNGVGAAISGDEKNVNNTEIKTAPQATTDDFNQAAIQPNRYLYNVNSVGPRVMGVTAEEFDRLARDKAISLLEGLDSDYNDNAIIDSKELPPSVDRGVTNLVKSIQMQGLSDDPEKIDMIINTIMTKLKTNA